MLSPRGLPRHLSNQPSRTLLQIPIPIRWNRFDPSTQEGRRLIADQIINHETTNEIADYLFQLIQRRTTKSSRCLYTREEFDVELAKPLAHAIDDVKPVPQKEPSMLWDTVIPSLWSLLPTPRSIH